MRDHLQSGDHGGQVWGLDGRRQLRLDFSANLWPHPVPDLPTVWRARLEPYPDPECRALIAAASRYYRVPANRILPVAGATQGLYLAMRVLRPRRLALFEPTFSEYEKAARWATDGRVEINRVFGRPKQNFAPEAPTPAGTDLAVLGHPNNPTGTLLPPQALAERLDHHERSGIRTIVDEAFLDFVEDPARHTVLRHLDRWPRALVLRSLTKRFGLAGMRVGFIFGTREVIEQVRALQIPWSVDTLAQHIGARLLRRPPAPGLSRRIERERAFLAHGLERLGFHVFPSVANFLLARMPESRSNDRLILVLRRKGIGLRNAGNFPGLDSSYVRCAVRPRNEVRQLLRTLEACW